MLYELVAGRLPFRGDHSQAVIYAIPHTEAEPLTVVRPGTARELDQVVGQVAKALALTLLRDVTARSPVGLLHWYTLVAGVFAGLAIAARGALFLAWKMGGTARTPPRAAALTMRTGE